jgi:hypothetical protein
MIKMRRRFVLILKKLTNLICLVLLVSALLIPTSAYASTFTTPSSSKNGFFQSFSVSTILSYFNNDKGKIDYQNYSNYSGGNHDGSNNNWWDCLVNWWCNDNGGHHGGGDNDECTNNKGTWGNDDGCLDSAEVWKRWYCN